jgi:hypothetical protein
MDNFLLWKAQVLPATRGAQLMGYLDGTTEPSKIVEVVKDNKKQAVPNTEHDAWLAKDQQLLGYLLNSLHKDVLAQVVEVTTSAELWSALQRMFSARKSAGHKSARPVGKPQEGQLVDSGLLSQDEGDQR